MRILKNCTIVIGMIWLALACTKAKECQQKNNADYNSNGCKNLFVYKKLESDTSSYLSVNVDRNRLILNEKEKLLTIGVDNTVYIQIDKYNFSGHHFNCTDAIIPFVEIINRWNGISGKVSVRIEDEMTGCDTRYSVTVQLTNAVLVDNQNDTIRVDYAKFENVLVNFSIP
ncbi:MAG: hypothetical protein JJU02_09060 [Cryomorphaceae bacterium]|nr:hypothetical protein [Cryomorphaceae bacterium]